MAKHVVANCRNGSKYEWRLLKHSFLRLKGRPPGAYEVLTILTSGRKHNIIGHSASSVLYAYAYENAIGGPARLLIP